jgi:anthranilate phosphoribosyltransferase
VQVLGVFDERWLEPLASALTALGVERAFIVHGTDGLDEISLSGPTHVAEAQRGTIRRYSVAPEDFGLARAPLEALAGGDATRNAAMIRKIFQGEPGPRRDIVLANAAPAVMASGLATNFLDAARVAAESIDSGAALDKLEQLVAFTQQSKG